MQFTEEQLAVINSNRKHVCVESGPGSGKTATVVGAIRARLAKGTQPSEIVAFTFTRRAGKELAERLGKDSRGMWIGTFHSVALDIIQRSQPEARVISEMESDVLLREAGRMTGVYDGIKWKHKGESGWRDTLERARREVFFGRESEAKIRSNYESLLRTGGEYDYPGVLLEACKILKSGDHPMSGVRLVFVDEAQDTDEIQWSMVDSIISEKTDGIYVGDLKQNLYNWRDARPDIFSARPRALHLRLSKSWRCTKPVMDAANFLISHNPEGTFPVVSEKDGEPVMVKDWDATFAVKYHLDLFYSPGDIAVLCRTNREVQNIAEALANDDIPVHREEIKEDHSVIYSILLAASRPDSPAATGLFREVAKKHLGLSTVVPLQLSVSKDPVERTVGRALLSEHAHVSQVMDDLADTIPESSRQWWIKEYGGHRIIDAVRDFSMREEQGGVIDGVVVQTIHQSKGLEYPVVVIPSVSQGLFPSKRSLANQESVEDERRVMFVAMTRSVERLVVLTNFSNMSQFIKEARLDGYPRPGDRRGVSEFDSAFDRGGEITTPW